MGRRAGLWIAGRLGESGPVGGERGERAGGGRVGRCMGKAGRLGGERAGWGRAGWLGESRPVGSERAGWERDGGLGESRKAWGLGECGLAKALRAGGGRAADSGRAGRLPKARHSLGRPSAHAQGWL